MESQIQLDKNIYIYIYVNENMSKIYTLDRGTAYFLPCLQLVGTYVQHIFRNLVPDLKIFGMSSVGGYMGETYVQKMGPG